MLVYLLMTEVLDKYLIAQFALEASGANKEWTDLSYVQLVTIAHQDLKSQNHVQLEDKTQFQEKSIKMIASHVRQDTSVIKKELEMLLYHQSSLVHQESSAHWELEHQDHVFQELLLILSYHHLQSKNVKLAQSIFIVLLVQEPQFLARVVHTVHKEEVILFCAQLVNIVFQMEEQ
jgi:phosphoribosyl-ATP pyrophosphohydrolase